MAAAVKTRAAATGLDSVGLVQAAAGCTAAEQGRLLHGLRAPQCDCLLLRLEAAVQQLHSRMGTASKVQDLVVAAAVTAQARDDEGGEACAGAP